MLATRPAITRVNLAVVLLTGAACSHVPLAQWPQFTEATVLAEFRVGPDGALRLPATTRELVVLDLVPSPQPATETFADGARALHYSAGTAVTVRCRYRAYAADDGRTPSAAELFPGANRLTTLDKP